MAAQQGALARLVQLAAWMLCAAAIVGASGLCYDAWRKSDDWAVRSTAVTALLAVSVAAYVLARTVEKIAALFSTGR